MEYHYAVDVENKARVIVSNIEEAIATATKHLFIGEGTRGLVRKTLASNRPASASYGFVSVTFTPLLIPYPDHCHHPRKCAGKGNCQRDPNCID